MSEGFVYFISCGSGLGGPEMVKIGWTSGNPHKRCASLQTGCPEHLNVAAYVPGTIEDERRLHQAFAPLAYRGEWFFCHGLLDGLICYIMGDLPKSDPRGSREIFESALHDVLMQGCSWHPSNPTPYEDYLATATWEPFHALLWERFGPWESVQ